MAYWLLLAVGDVYAVNLFLKIGIAPKRIISMICRLHELCEQDPVFMKRWCSRLLNIFVTVTRMCEGLSVAHE